NSRGSPCRLEFPPSRNTTRPPSIGPRQARSVVKSPGQGRRVGRADKMPIVQGARFALEAGREGRESGDARMKTLLFIVAWCLLFVLCWPLALFAIVLWPLLWLLSLPFRLVSITLEAVFAL